ncbi:MAG: hypothetical protein HDR95_07280 [Bacteroides sp.]|nr:hypothetical protein [Bacteroides sp.]
MKKYLAIALTLASVASMSAQKANVDQANKLAGKVADLQTARNLIKEAAQNPETQSDPRTYFTGGKVEFSAFDKGAQAASVNPESVDAAALAENLLNGYNYFVMTLPLDGTQVDEKGKPIKAKYKKDISNILSTHAPQFFEQGGAAYNAKALPTAYQLFKVYGDMPELVEQGVIINPAITNENRALAYYYAGLSAYYADMVNEAADVLAKGRPLGFDEPTAYILEIASWQNIAQKDTARQAEAAKAIEVAAQAGYDKFGLEQPVFLNNLVNARIMNDDFQGALNLLNDVIAANPDNGNLYGMRAFVYDRMDNNDASLADYRKSAEMETTDFENLKNAAKKIMRVGTEKWNIIEGNSAEAQAAREDVKNNYFLQAKHITDLAKTKEGGADDYDLQNVIENIDYVLETYFNN